MNKSQTDFHMKNLKLKTPFGNDTLKKIKRIVKSMKFYLKKFLAYMKTTAIDVIINKYQFKIIIKQSNIGLINIKIDYY